MAEHGDKERFSKSVNFEKNHVLWAHDLLKKEISKSIDLKTNAYDHTWFKDLRVNNLFLVLDQSKCQTNKSKSSWQIFSDNGSWV